MRDRVSRRYFYLSLFIAFSCCLVAISCEDESGLNDNFYSVTATPSPMQEVPPVNSNAAGTMDGDYNANTNQFRYAISWSGLSGEVTSAHFHAPAFSGQNAAPVHDIPVVSNGTSGNAFGTIIIADSTEQHLFSGRVYFNLHTAAFPNGELRGQLILRNN